jgi:hypothetical protein
MIQPSVEIFGRKHNAPYTHRRYLVAAALGEAGAVFKTDTHRKFEGIHSRRNQLAGPVRI